MRKRQLQYPKRMLDEIVDKSIIPNLSTVPTTSKLLFYAILNGLRTIRHSFCLNKNTYNLSILQEKFVFSSINIIYKEIRYGFWIY